MKRNLLVGVLALTLFICLSFTGNAFANTYAFVLEQNNDRIQIYNVEGKSLAKTIDLDKIIDLDNDPSDLDNLTQKYGVITALTAGPSGRYWYFVTDKVGVPGKLYQVDVAGDIENNIEQFSVVELTQVGKKPKALVAGRYGKYVYVANYGSDSVTIYKRKIGAELQTVSTKTGFYKPVAINITDGNDIFVANWGTNTVTVFNASSDNFEIVLDNKPTDIIITPDYEYVYVCNSGETQGRISVIRPVDYNDYDDDGDEIFDDDVENTIIATIEIGDALPTKMSMVEGGDYIYAIDPVWTENETKTDISISAVVNKMTIIDCSGRMNGINTVSETIEADSDFIGMTSTKNGRLVYTVGGVDDSVYKIDNSSDPKVLTEELDIFSDGSGVFQDIVIGGTMPLAPTFLKAEGEKAGVELEWTDNSFDETGFLIYRLDQDDEDKEYKSYLIDKIKSNLEFYLDDTVRKGKRYTYHVVAFNDVARSSVGTPATVKAKDTSDTKICFISSSESADNNMIIAFSLLFLAALFFQRKHRVLLSARIKN